MPPLDPLDPFETGPESRRATLFLEDEEAHAVRAARLRALQTRSVPRLRLLGFNLIALVAVPLHNAVLGGGSSGGGDAGSWLPFLLGVNAYCLASWAVLAAWYRPHRTPDLALLFLALDLVPMGVAIQLTGGTTSWLFWLPLVRVVDQAGVTARRTLVFGVLAVVTWLAVAAADGAGHTTPWQPELIKALFLAATAGYVVLTARAAEGLRRRTASAVRVGRHLVTQLRVRSRELEEERRKAEREGSARAAALAEVSRVLVRATSSAQTVIPGPATLRALVAELGELAEREAGLHALDLRPVRLPRVLERAVAAAEPAALENGVRLEWSVPDPLPTVLADPRALHRVLLNLLRHAVERSAPVGNVRLWAQAREGLVRIGVSDSAETPAGEEAAPLRGAAPAEGARAGLSFAASLAARMAAGTGVEPLAVAGSVYWIELHAVEAAPPVPAHPAFPTTG